MRGLGLDFSRPFSDVKIVGVPNSNGRALAAFWSTTAAVVDQNADMLGRSSSDPMILLHESKRNSLFMGSLLIQILMKRPPST